MDINQLNYQQVGQQRRPDLAYGTYLLEVEKCSVQKGTKGDGFVIDYRVIGGQQGAQYSPVGFQGKCYIPMQFDSCITSINAFVMAVLGVPEEAVRTGQFDTRPFVIAAQDPRNILLGCKVLAQASQGKAKKAQPQQGFAAPQYPGMYGQPQQQPQQVAAPAGVEYYVNYLWAVHEQGNLQAVMQRLQQQQQPQQLPAYAQQPQQAQPQQLGMQPQQAQPFYAPQPQQFGMQPQPMMQAQQPAPMHGQAPPSWLPPGQVLPPGYGR